MIIKVSDVHKKIKFISIKSIFEQFGEIDGYIAQEDYFIFRYSSRNEYDVLNMDYFSLGGKRIRVTTSNFNGKLDTFNKNGGTNVVFNGDIEFDIEDIKNECSMYGKIREVYKTDKGNVVSTYSPSDSLNIYLHMYGRFYRNKRIRCFIE